LATGRSWFGVFGIAVSGHEGNMFAYHFDVIPITRAVG